MPARIKTSEDNVHYGVADIRQLAGSTQWMALDNDGNMDCSITVHNCGDGVFILESMWHRSFWQQHGEDCAYHSDRLNEMTDKAQALVAKKMKEMNYVG